MHRHTHTDRQIDHSQSETHVARNSCVCYLTHFCDPRRSQREGRGNDFGSQFGVQFFKVGKRGSRGWVVRHVSAGTKQREMSSSALFVPVKTPPYILGPHTLRMGHPDSVVSSRWSLMDRPGNLPPSSSTFCHLTITRNHHMEWHVLFNLSTKHLPTEYQCAPPVLATFISVRPRWCAVLGHSHLQTNSPGLWFKVTEKLEAVGTSSSPSVVKTRIITRGG